MARVRPGQGVSETGGDVKDTVRPWRSQLGDTDVGNYQLRGLLFQVTCTRTKEGIGIVLSRCLAFTRSYLPPEETCGEHFGAFFSSGRSDLGEGPFGWQKKPRRCGDDSPGMPSLIQRGEYLSFPDKFGEALRLFKVLVW